MTDLYNGNIAYQVIANKKLMEMNAGNGLNDDVIFKKYRYDQLNRLKSMDVVSGLAGNTWGPGGTAWNACKVRLDFDRNGNILSLDRWGRTQQMDELSYAYNRSNGMLVDNMLDHVTDPKGVIGNDIGSQSSGNYDYDEIGNLISDAGEEVDEILCDHYGKVSRVGRLPSSTKAELVFAYDAGGNRFRKKVEPASGDAETQYYVRDPQGNVLAIYRRHSVSAEEVLDLNELHIYGSERLGILSDVERVATGAASSGGSGSGQRAVSPEGHKNVIVSGVLASEVADLVVLRNVSAERIDLDGVALRSGGQFFELDALELDAGERAVIAFGDGSDEVSVLELLGRAVDTAEVWVWQDFVGLDAAGGSLQVLLEGEVLESLDYAAGANERVTYSLHSWVVDPSDLVSGDAFGQAARRGFLAGAGFVGASRVQVERGRKMYELRDHLGNVAVVLGDRAVGTDDDADGFVDWFEGSVRSARDFYPFGMVMSGREYSVPDYRYGFNGKESDDEWLGVGNAVSYKYRVADARLGRFFSVDPLAPKYPWYSPYSFSGNRFLDAIELEGLEPKGLPNSWVVTHQMYPANNSWWINVVRDRSGDVYGVYQAPIEGTKYSRWYYMSKPSTQMLIETGKSGGSLILFKDEQQVAAQTYGAWMDYCSFMEQYFVYSLSLVLAGPEEVFFAEVAPALAAKTAPWVGGFVSRNFGKLKKWAGRQARKFIENTRYDPETLGNLIPGRKSKKAARGVRSAKSLMKKALLLTKGRIRFVPRPSDVKNGKLLKQNDGYVDKFGNVWQKGPSRTAGEAFEWDVQLSKTGREHLGKYSRDGSHLNVSLDGKITHK